MEFDGVNQNLA